MATYGGPLTLGLLGCLSMLALPGVKVAFVESFSPTTPHNSGCSKFQGHKGGILRRATCHSTCVCRERTVSIHGTTIAATNLCSSFSHEPIGEENEQQQSPRAVLLVGSAQSSEEEQRLVSTLTTAGFGDVEVSVGTRLDVSERNDGAGVCIYELSRATGMLKLISSSGSDNDVIEGGTVSVFDPPTWIPMVRGEENVLVANGWSFLDPDESEPMSAFDIDDANAEGEYKPKWGTSNHDTIDGDLNREFQLSSLGYDLSPLSKENVLSEADSLSASNQFSRDVLLHGKTDPPNTKITCNGYDFKGSSGQSDIPEGIFFAAIGGLPLFSSKDLAPTTASSGWLSFARPLDVAHVLHTQPEKDSIDQRIEVVCARSMCHLGHYFGPTEGYCINASALRFLPSAPTYSTTTPFHSNTSMKGNLVNSLSNGVLPMASRPVSWRPLDEDLPRNGNEALSPSHRVLKKVLETHGKYERIVLGCGCFWHVEAALRNLQGVVSTETCFAGGHTMSPTYQAVCEGSTGHAEVVSVVYDPELCPTNILMDCFLAMHDPTMVKAHGKHALHTGQYRSCVFVANDEVEKVAKKCLEDCRQQLGKELSTEIRNMSPKKQYAVDADVVDSFGEGWCWRAEDEHQRHDERIRRGLREALPEVLSANEWLSEYGRRTPSTMGGSLESALHPDDDGMAMMMI